MMPEQPSIGRTVHFVLHEGPRIGSHRPAVVVSVKGMMVNLQVLTDGNRTKGDKLPGTFWRYDVNCDPEGKEPGSWHWPERVGQVNHGLNEMVKSYCPHAVD